MWSERFKALLLALLIPIACLLSGCGYAVKYKLNDKDIVAAESPKPLRVQVTNFDDTREDVERTQSARKKNGESDTGDYTYDKQFQGDVAEEITMMLVKHLDYSNVFEDIKKSPLDSEWISAATLDSLRQEGTDGVISGEVEHFYGYYDKNIGRQLLYGLPLGIASGLLLNFSTTEGPMTTTYFWYGPGLVLGTYLESLHTRKIERHVQLNARLISTTTYEPVWEDSFEVVSSERKSMPGISTEKRKFEITVSGLRDAVNLMVKSLDAASLAATTEPNVSPSELPASDNEQSGHGSDESATESP